VGLRDRFARIFNVAGGAAHTDGVGELQVGDAAYDDWDIVRDFEDLDTARAWHQVLAEQGYAAVLTSDWPLDEFGRGDISLRVPAGLGLDAEELLESD
jgi:hypothetical protein